MHHNLDLDERFPVPNRKYDISIVDIRFLLHRSGLLNVEEYSNEKCYECYKTYFSHMAMTDEQYNEMCRRYTEEDR